MPGANQARHLQRRKLVSLETNSTGFEEREQRVDSHNEISETDCRSNGRFLHSTCFVHHTKRGLQGEVADIREPAATHAVGVCVPGREIESLRIDALQEQTEACIGKLRQSSRREFHQFLHILTRGRALQPRMRDHSDRAFLFSAASLHPAAGCEGSIKGEWRAQRTRAQRHSGGGLEGGSGAQLEQGSRESFRRGAARRTVLLDGR